MTNHSDSDFTAIKEVLKERLFNAPRALVFKAWTDEKHLANWWGPKGFTNPVCELDARPGGTIRIVMRAPDGFEIPVKGVFDRVDPPERLAFTLTNFEDEHGVPQLEVHTIVTFTEHGSQTKLNLRALVIKAHPTVEAALAGMDDGWNESLELLEREINAALQGGDSGAPA
jgi:uncharacterized protein YndB with AHSA1/START domain